uniref:Uncharacterized protein n=1 Tax=Branchiostoma floridae TaxID=7739 RepID=C3ZN07_BRAFL|eukprot:XP_002590136.1 hypothetical protein BRAFLDRAFT_83416 [Branchiostoma floridae]
MQGLSPCHVADRPRPDVPPRRPFYSQPACYRRRPTTDPARPMCLHAVPLPSLPPDLIFQCTQPLTLVVAEGQGRTRRRPEAVRSRYVSMLSCRRRRRLLAPTRRAHPTSQPRLSDPARRACLTRPHSFTPRTRCRLDQSCPVTQR